MYIMSSNKSRVACVLVFYVCVRVRVCARVFVCMCLCVLVCVCV